MSLESRSEYFHAFEWLRAEALKGNKHAEKLLPRMVDIEARVKKAEANLKDIAVNLCGLCEEEATKNLERVYAFVEGEIEKQYDLRVKAEAMCERLAQLVETIGTIAAEDGCVYRRAKETLAEYRRTPKPPQSAPDNPCNSE